MNKKPPIHSEELEMKRRLDQELENMHPYYKEKYKRTGVIYTYFQYLIAAWIIYMVGYWIYTSL